MNILKIIGGLLAVFLASISVSFIILSQNAPNPDPKSPEDIVWEFLIKDRPMNPEVLKNQLIASIGSSETNITKLKFQIRKDGIPINIDNIKF